MNRLKSFILYVLTFVLGMAIMFLFHTYLVQEETIDMIGLNDENREGVDNPTTDLYHNEVIATKLYTEIISIDGIFRPQQNQKYLLKYDDEMYLPATVVASAFGSIYSFDSSCCFTIEGNTSDESIIATKSVITPKNVSYDTIISLLGEDYEKEEYVDDAYCGCKVVTVKDNHAEFTFRIIDDQPSLQWYKIISNKFTTQRGISVGSSKDKVIEKYGDFLIKSEVDGLERWYSNDLVTGIWFSFIDNAVAEYGIWFVNE